MKDGFNFYTLRMQLLEKPGQNESQGINLKELFSFIWTRKWKVVATSLSFSCAAAIYAFVIAKPLFESSALLLPVQTNSLDQMGAASMLVGGKMFGNGEVELYQSLLTSRTVVGKLLKGKIADSASNDSLALCMILKVDTLNKQKWEDAILKLGKNVKVGARESGTGGIVEVSSSAVSPWLAQQITSKLLQVGQEEIRLVRIERSNVISSRLAIAVAQAKSEWDSASRAVAWFQSRNRSIVLPEQALAMSRLEIEKQAKEQKYLLARKEYELVLLERAKAAPPMMILDPASLPARAVKPKKKLIIAFAFFAGLCLSIGGMVLWRSVLSSEE